MCLLNRKEAQPTVQVSREITTTNGCRVTLTFAEKEDPNLQHAVAEMLLAAFIKRRSMLYEASALPVQSVHQRTGGYHSAGGCTSNICCKMFIATVYNKNAPS